MKNEKPVSCSKCGHKHKKSERKKDADYNTICPKCGCDLFMSISQYNRFLSETLK